jgi:hypothetical protein
VKRPPGERAITLLTGLGIELADAFKIRFVDRRLNGPACYTPEMAAPEGLALAGSKQPLQEIKLVPERGPILVMGSANLINKRAELRTFAYMDQLHRQKWKGAPFGADPAEYGALIEDIRGFLVARRYEVSLQDAVAAPPPPPAPAPVSVPPPPPSKLRAFIKKLVRRRT